MLIPIYLSTNNNGYIAGSNDGIVTVLGKPSARGVVLLSADKLQVEGLTTSLVNGHYLFRDLDPDKEYLVMARDYKREVEPFAWDYVKPATDLSNTQQQALWQSWQT